MKYLNKIKLDQPSTYSIDYDVRNCKTLDNSLQRQQKKFHFMHSIAFLHTHGKHLTKRDSCLTNGV